MRTVGRRGIKSQQKQEKSQYNILSIESDSSYKSNYFSINLMMIDRSIYKRKRLKQRIKQIA